MRNLSEMAWKALEGKLLHMKINSVYPGLPGEVVIDFKILETDDYLTVTVATEDAG